MIFIMCNVSGKGCSTVLIPARVVQALQLHFDQMAATSGPKPGAFHPLHGTQYSTTFISSTFSSNNGNSYCIFSYFYGVK